MDTITTNIQDRLSIYTAGSTPKDLWLELCSSCNGPCKIEF